MINLRKNQPFAYEPFYRLTIGDAYQTIGFLFVCVNVNFYRASMTTLGPSFTDHNKH